MKKVIMLFLLLAAGGSLFANETVYTGPLINESGLTYNATYTLDLRTRRIDLISFQANFATMSPTSVSFIDGTPSTTSLNMSKFAQMTVTSATNTITISSNTSAALSGAVITLNGTRLVEGTNWGRGATFAATMNSLALAMNSVSGFASAVQVSSTIVSTSATPGSFGNQYTLTSSTPAALNVGNPTFLNGKDNLIVYVNGVPLKQGTDWTAQTSSQVTAKGLSDAIQANSTLASLITSTWTAGGIVTATSTFIGTAANMSIYSSSPNILSPAQPSVFTGGTATNLSTATLSIQKTNNFSVGLPVLFGVGAGTPPANLVDKTTYFVTLTPNATNFQLSSTKANAVLGTAISVSTQFATGNGSFTLTPLAYSTNTQVFPGLQWQISNDGSNWVNYSSSITFTSITTSSSSVWNFGQIGYNWIRALVAPPLQGGVSITVPARGVEQR